jgi:hypothetical protein
MQWKFHPYGGKDGPISCDLLNSGIWVSKSGLEEDKQFCILCVEKVTDGKILDKEGEATIRRMEMLRHFPVVARQFHHDGTLMDQNPEHTDVYPLFFGIPNPTKSIGMFVGVSRTHLH